jgi:hypothetical protein
MVCNVTIYFVSERLDTTIANFSFCTSTQVNNWLLSQVAHGIITIRQSHKTCPVHSKTTCQLPCVRMPALKSPKLPNQYWPNHVYDKWAIQYRFHCLLSILSLCYLRAWIQVKMSSHDMKYFQWTVQGSMKVKMHNRRLLKRCSPPWVSD